MNIAIITGATSGIGKEFYRLVVRHYTWLDEIWCIGRDPQRLYGLPFPKNSRLRVFKLDVTKKEDLRSFANALKEGQGIQIKLLINGAGTGKYGPVGESSVEELLETVKVNCEGLTAMTRICLSYMRPKSRIIQMCSGAAFFPQPDFAVYSASKAYVYSFSRALARELKPKGITVTTVCPGPVDTPFLEKSRKGKAVPAYKNRGIAKASLVAEKALRDGARGKELSIYGGPMKSLYVLTSILPSNVLTGAVDSLNRYTQKGAANEKN